MCLIFKLNNKHTTDIMTIIKKKLKSTRYLIILREVPKNVSDEQIDYEAYRV